MSAEASVTSVFTLLHDQGSGDYIGERISQLEHCLQAANSARLANAPPTTILAALLHDIGQFLPGDATAQLLYKGQNVGRVGHEKLGEDWLAAEGWPKEVTELVGAHVIAKRYLTGTSAKYLADLSSASQASLVLQGGPFTPAEVAAFETDPLWKEKIQLRQWDDAAKVVDLVTPGLDYYKTMAVDILTTSRAVMV